jgi:ACS family hexuronate transporter-like MFS transporter
MTPIASLEHSPRWKWYVCGLLLLATMINYMDRQTLSLVKSDISKDFERQGATLDDQQYGNLEAGFSLAFAFGAIIHGFLADRWSVRWYYPLVLVGWSAAGFATALANDYSGLLLCRTALGFFESGQWPCALKTSQSILSGRDRTLGNGILQSGAALGAILTPQITKVLVGSDPTAWRMPFQIIGVLGLVWVIPWLLLIRRDDLSHPSTKTGDQAPNARSPLATALFVRRFAVLTTVVITINLSWHFLRAWLTPFLREARGYHPDDAADMTTFYYLAADLGSISVGMLVHRIMQRGWSVHEARLTTFGFSATLASLAVFLGQLPAGRELNLLLVIVGFGALGVFPNYYTFSQELTTKHQGLLTGVLSFLTWTSTAIMQALIGEHVKRTKSYSEAFYFAGAMPIVAFFALLLFWNRSAEKQTRAGGASAPATRVEDN